MIRTALELASVEIWALDQDRAELLARIADRDIDSADMAALRLRLGLPAEWTSKALATRDGRAVDSELPGVEMRGDVAVIPLIGTMFRRANLFTDFSGGTSTEAFAKAFQTAADDPAVRAIIPYIDSPGGEANGVNEAAKLIYSARGKKPIKTYGAGLVASGAFWVGAAADELVIDDTALLGSVGVVTQIQKRADREGVKTIEIVSSQSPMKRPDAETDEGRAVIQARVDAMAQVFVDAVAAYRGVSAEHVTENFGRGHVLVGRHAVAVKAADRIGTFEALVAELNQSASSGRSGSIFQGVTMSSENSKSGQDTVPTASITVAYIAEKHPQVAESLRLEGHAKGLEAGRADGIATGRAEGAKSERERIQGLEEAAMPGHEDLLAKAKADGKSTGPDLAMAIIKAEKAKGQGYLDALKSDSDSVPMIDPPTGNGGGASNVSALASIEDRAKAEWDKDAKVRADFGDSFADYLSYRKAEDAGQIKRRSFR